MSVSRKRRRVPESVHAKLWEDQLFNDAFITCGSKSFPVHCLVLITASPVFANMFASRMQETTTRTVNIVDYSPAVVESMLKFVYKGTLPEGSWDPIDLALYEIANKYEITSLIRTMGSRMWLNLNQENVFICYQAVHRFSRAGSSEALKLWEALYTKIKDDAQLFKAFVEHSLE